MVHVDDSRGPHYCTNTDMWLMGLRRGDDQTSEEMVQEDDAARTHAEMTTVQEEDAARTHAETTTDATSPTRRIREPAGIG